MKKILVVGCSFSHHTNKNENECENSWVECMKDKFANFLYIMNLSQPGASNELIKRIITKKVLEERWDYVIVQWSTIDRWDYPVQHNENTTIVRYWPIGSNTTGIKYEFYKNYYSVYGAVIDTLENILFIQQLLNSENIPYSMITIGNLFTLSTTIKQIENLMIKNGNYYESKENVLQKMQQVETIFADADSVPFLFKKIDYDKFLFTDKIRNPFGGGMLEWLYEEKNDYPKNNWHFDKTQSECFLNEFIIPKILKPNGII